MAEYLFGKLFFPGFIWMLGLLVFELSWRPQNSFLSHLPVLALFAPLAIELFRFLYIKNNFNKMHSAAKGLPKWLA